MKRNTFIIACIGAFIVGWLANEFITPQQANARGPFEYKVVDSGDAMFGSNASSDKFEAILNTHAKEGWKFLPLGASSWIIFERQK